MKPQHYVNCYTECNSLHNVEVSVTDKDVNEFKKKRIGTGDPWTDLQK